MSNARSSPLTRKCKRCFGWGWNTHDLESLLSIFYIMERFHLETTWFLKLSSQANLEFRGNNVLWNMIEIYPNPNLNPYKNNFWYSNQTKCWLVGFNMFSRHSQSFSFKRHLILKVWLEFLGFENWLKIATLGSSCSLVCHPCLRKCNM